MTFRIGRCALAVGLAAGAIGCADGDPCEEVGAICTVAGNGERGLGDPAGSPTEQSLSSPFDVAAAPDGRLYISDVGNYCVRELDQAAGTMRLAMGTTGIGEGCPVESGECDALEIDLSGVVDLAFDGGEALVADAFRSRVLRVDLASGRVTGVAGTGTRTRYSGDGGPATEADLSLPSSVVTDPVGGFYILDQENQVVRRVGQDGVIDTVAGGCFTDDYATGSGDPSCSPADDPVACEGSEKLACGDPDQACASPCLPGFAGDGGPARDARLAFEYGANIRPSRIALTPSGELLIADTLNRRIRRVDAEGVITTVAGDGADGGGDGVLSTPYDVAVDAEGTIYVADGYNACVQAIRPGGELYTVAGRCGARGFSGDEGPAREAQLDQPLGIEIAGDFLYIADTGNDRIRAVRLR